MQPKKIFVRIDIIQEGFTDLLQLAKSLDRRTSGHLSFVTKEAWKTDGLAFETSFARVSERMVSGLWRQ